MLQSIRRFLKDARGALAVEFVVGIPLIFAAQALAFEVGRIILDKHALESGVRDATRFLARANISACPTDGSTYGRVYLSLVNSGLKSTIAASDITCTFIEMYDGEGGILNRDFTGIQVVAEITVETPLIGWWGGGITIAASDQARFIGE